MAKLVKIKQINAIDVLIKSNLLPKLKRAIACRKCANGPRLAIFALDESGPIALKGIAPIA